MKSLEQVINYTSRCSFDEVEWERVLDFCKSKYGGGKIHKALKPVSASTYDLFIDWYNVGIGSGDIVRYGHMIGLVGNSTPDFIELVLYRGFNDQLVNGSIIAQPYKIFAASEDEVSEFRRDMSLKELSFSVRSALVHDSFKPDPYSYVAVIINDNREVGLFERTENDKHYFVAISDNGKLKLDCFFSVGVIGIEDTNRKEIIDFQSLLAKNNLEWMPRSKTLRRVPKRNKYNTKYWHITDRFTVTAALDMRTPTHDTRFENGNYFSSYTEALVFLQKLKDLRDKLNGESD